jgi:hypothetical protein
MGLFNQLVAAANSQPAPRSKKPSNNKPSDNKPWIARRAKADAKYRKILLGKSLTTGQIAGLLGYSHCGTLSSLHALEKRKCVIRIGTQERPVGVPHGRGSTLWTWNNETEMHSAGAQENKDDALV